MQEIVNYFQIKFDEDTCISPIVEHWNRLFMNKAG